MSTTSPRILVLGIGNLLWADEAFGVRAVERMNALYRFPENVTLMDGGTQGLYLVNFIQEADHLLVFDAVDYGLTPGTIQVAEGDEVPKFTGVKKMSLHQTGFQEVLSAADLLGRGYPTKLKLIGIQAETLDDWGGPMTATVRNRMDEVVDMGRRTLEDWGVTAQPRAKDDPAPMLEHGLDDTRYEAESPTDQEVFRSGDARFIFS